MTTLCKTTFSFDSIKLHLASFVSIFVHLLLFYKVASPLAPSAFEKLLGKKGGLADATEVSFFPSFANRAPTAPLPGTSPLDLPTQTKGDQRNPSELAPPSPSDTDSKGIGQGGSSIQYASILHAYLDSAKVFPRALKDLGLSGVVKVRFQVTPEGNLKDIRLAESDAPKLLQQEAIRFLQKLDKVPLPPAHYTYQQLQFELPLRYELKS
ncbi:MAG: energy transducer TonB [Proteobacteria bacterium]|nr:energy transducer TonB [Pseudomonadota bacterium]